MDRMILDLETLNVETFDPTASISMEPLASCTTEDSCPVAC